MATVRLLRLCRIPMLVLALMITTLALLFVQPVAAAVHPTTGDLERGYQAAKTSLATHTAALSRARSYLTETTAIVARLRAQGYDTHALAQALAMASERLAAAGSELASAGARLTAANNGFDQAGKVIDATAARATLAVVARHLQRCHQLASSALTLIAQAMRAFIAANPGRIPPFPLLPRLPAVLR